MLKAEILLKRSVSLDLLKQLPEPKNFWKYFLVLTETPRPSHDLDLVRNVLLGLAEKLECQADVDEAGNVRYRKKATPGMENAPKVVLQGHMDMVTTANSDKNIDFHKDPIDVIIDGDKMSADRTTLGADNGVAISAALAYLEEIYDGKIKEHGLIECLFTADEETTMAGAEFLAPYPYLEGDILLNLDSEEEYAICVGCAGGSENDFEFELEKSNGNNENLTNFKISLTGLTGGHSGIEIHCGRGNANKLIIKMLNFVYSEVPFYVVSVKGGDAPNVIPREAYAEVAVENADLFKEKLAEAFDKIKQLYEHVEYKIEDNKKVSLMNLDIEQIDSDDEPLSKESTEKLLNIINIFYQGVITKNQDMIKTSTNLSNILVDSVSSTLKLHSFTRSSSQLELDFYQKELECFAKSFNGTCSPPLCAFPGWDFKESEALEILKEAHLEVMNREAKIYSVHAGLECGLIQGVYPEMTCLSIGPTIEGAHSHQETLFISSVPRFYNFLRTFLTKIYSK